MIRPYLDRLQLLQLEYRPCDAQRAVYTATEYKRENGVFDRHLQTLLSSIRYFHPLPIGEYNRPTLCYRKCSFYSPFLCPVGIWVYD